MTKPDIFNIRRSSVSWIQRKLEFVSHRVRPNREVGLVNLREHTTKTFGLFPSEQNTAPFLQESLSSRENIPPYGMPLLVDQSLIANANKSASSSLKTPLAPNNIFVSLRNTKKDRQFLFITKSKNKEVWKKISHPCKSYQNDYGSRPILPRLQNWKRITMPSLWHP